MFPEKPVSNPVMKSSILTLSIGIGLLVQSAAGQSTYTPDRAGYFKKAVPMFRKYCLECHSEKKAKSNFRVDQDLPNNFLDVAVAEKWVEVLDLLNVGEMPPEDHPHQPTADMVAYTAGWIEQELDRAEEFRNGSQVVLRRLNRNEYRNTIRDLVGIEIDPDTELGFPPDSKGMDGFDTAGTASTMSQRQLELYMEAAEEILDRAIYIGERPKTEKVRWDGSVFTNSKTAKDTVFGAPAVGRGNITPTFKGFTIPKKGNYLFRINAYSTLPSRQDLLKQIRTFWKFKKWEEKPENVALVLEDPGYGTPGNFIHLRHENVNRGTIRIRGKFQVENPKPNPEVLEFPIFFDAGEDRHRIILDDMTVAPRFGTMHLHPFWHRHPNYADKARLADVHALWFELEGPVFDQWPPKSNQMIFIDSPAKTTGGKAYAEEVLKDFATRAWRRPATTEETARLVALYDDASKDEPVFEQAMKRPLLAILSSPNFIFLTEPAPNEKTGAESPVRNFTSANGEKKMQARATGRTVEKVRIAQNNQEMVVPVTAFSAMDQQFIKTLPTVAAVTKGRVLTDHELASRLSYFLWSTMPDEELWKHAGTGDIQKPETLLSQVRRMLKDPRREQLINRFATQWLELYEIGVNPPSREYFPYYDEHVEHDMKRETLLFFQHILDRDLNCRNFLDSDWIMVNQKMANYYDIPGVKGKDFRAVKLPAGSPRGGLIGQASILALTSNGTRTSPVIRGVWLLERLLGDPPPPPPPNAGEVEQPTIKDTLSIRQKLEIHREDASCKRCHQKIDPLGFALENFDGSGQWRTHQALGKFGAIKANSPAIDAKATMPDGTEFEGVEGLKKELLKRTDEFYACLAKKMAAYALGRDLTRGDKKMIQEAVQHMKQNGGTLRSLIEYIVTSPQFFTT